MRSTFPVATRWSLSGALALALASAASAEPAAAPDTVFKVCAPPYSLPMSDMDGSGYENRIASLFAKQLGATVRYTWFPQRLGFIRATLKNNETEDGEYKCDVVMGVPENFELAATTQPYMRSTWAMIYAKGAGLDWIKTQDDLKKMTAEQTRCSSSGFGIRDQPRTGSPASALSSRRRPSRSCPVIPSKALPTSSRPS